MDQFAHPISQQLRAAAVALPEVGEGSSCVNRAFKARKKNFLFVGEKGDSVRVMVKLTDSLEAAEATGDPRVVVGKFGWVTMNFPHDAPPPVPLEDWVVESYRACAPKTLVKQLDAG